MPAFRELFSFTILAIGLVSPVAALAAEEPVFVTGRIAATKELMVQSRQRLGDHGVLAIRSAERWEAIQAELIALGWPPPVSKGTRKIDFEKQMLVLVYKNGDELDAFSLRDYIAGENSRFEVAMSYFIYKQRGEIVERLNFLLATVPLAAKLDVAVLTYHPQNGGPYLTPDKARLEWQGAVGSAVGDVASGLRGRIEPAALAVNTGIDLQMKFVLEFAGGALVKEGRFASQVDAVKVWDGKYSSGYRNHAFQVVTPDGKSHYLRPKVIEDWSKNAPHPVAVTAEKPYVLPEWIEGHVLKSLAALGLETSLPGRYEITGVYEESAQTIERGEARHDLWGGTLATNTVVVEVTKP